MNKEKVDCRRIGSISLSNIQFRSSLVGLGSCMSEHRILGCP